MISRPQAEDGLVVTLMEPQDAPGVAGLFRAVYGEGYPIRTYYEPQELIAANRAGRIISSVAKTPEGRVVGHNALFQVGPNPKVYENGAGLVHPDFRVARLFGRMVDHNIQHGAPLFGAETVYGEVVLNHPYTQRLDRSQGHVNMALEVDLMPAAAYSQEKSAEGRVASIMSFKTLLPRPHRVHLPAEYDPALRWLYEALDDRRELAVADQDLPAGTTSRIESQVFAHAQVARMTFWETGPDLAQALDRTEAVAAAQGVTVFQAWLNLGRPWVGAAARLLAGRGYFLGGVLPRWFGDDGLLMQRIAHAPHWDGIKMEFPRGQELLRLVRADWRRVCGGEAA
ncbi:MAG: hypothetical protein ACOZHQ_14380 [Thermodesulfobacteriota bacterium]